MTTPQHTTPTSGAPASAGDARTVGASAAGAGAVGALAVGAFAVGALAIGRLAIRRLVVRESRLRSVVVDELTVGRLCVGDLAVTDRLNLADGPSGETPTPVSTAERSEGDHPLATLAGAAALATLAGLKLYGDRERRVAEARYPPVGHFVTVDGARLHYLSRGAGRPVVLLHASGVVLHDFTTSVFDDVAASHHAIAFDRPGYGYSGRPAREPLTLALNARMLHGALKALGVDEPIIVGHSYGGSVALRYALDFSDDVAGLVLVAPGAYARGLSVPPISYLSETPGLGPLFLHTLLAPVTQMVGPKFTATLFAPDSPPVGYTEMVEAFASRPAQFRAFATELKLLGAGLRDQSPRYGEIRVPVAILAGTADRVHHPEDHERPLHNAVPRGDLVMVPGAGHALHHSHPEVVVEAIRRVQVQAHLR